MTTTQKNAVLAFALAAGMVLATYLLLSPVDAHPDLPESNTIQSGLSAEQIHNSTMATNSGATDDARLQEQQLTALNANVLALEAQLGQLGNYVHPDYETLKSTATESALEQFLKENRIFDMYKRMRSETPEDLEFNVRMAQAGVLRVQAVPLSELGIESERLNEIIDKLVNARIEDQRVAFSAHPDGMPEPTNGVDTVLREMLSEQEFESLKAMGRAQLRDQYETVVRYGMAPYTSLLSNEQRSRVAQVVIQHSATVNALAPDAQAPFEPSSEALSLAHTQLQTEFSSEEMAQINAYLRYRETSLRWQPIN